MKKIISLLSILATLFTLSCGPKQLTKVYHTGSIDVVFPDTTINLERMR